MEAVKNTETETETETERAKRRRLRSNPRFKYAEDVVIWVRVTNGGSRNYNEKWFKVNISSTLLEKLSQNFYFDNSKSNRVIICDIDPNLNGPFDIPKPINSDHRILDYYLPRCACIGTVMYAVGGDPTALGELATGRIVFHSRYRNFKTWELPIIEEPVTGGKPSYTCPPKNNTTYNTSHRFHYLDFSQPHLKWEISGSPLNTPRHLPELVTMDGKLYVFGSYDISDEGACFGEVYDPSIGYWVPLPKPPFGRFFDEELIVIPIPKYRKLMVLGVFTNMVYTFDTFTWYWHPCKKCPDLPKTLHVFGIREGTTVLLSESNDVLYWISRGGFLCAYNWLNGKHCKGLLSGTESEHVIHILRHPVFFNLGFLPLSKNLLGLIWCQHWWDDMVLSSTLHINALHVNTNIDTDTDSDYQIEPFLAVTVGKCLTYTFMEDEGVNFIDALSMDSQIKMK